MGGLVLGGGRLEYEIRGGKGSEEVGVRVGVGLW